MFKLKKTQSHPTDKAGLAEVALRNINDGVIITDAGGVVELINPAAQTMTSTLNENQAIGLDYGLLLRLLGKDGRAFSNEENPLVRAMQTGQPLTKFQCYLRIGNTDKSLPIALSMVPVDDGSRIITFRDITQELEEEGEQAEFISTASHEMRTPVATIDGYLMLCLNPQTATVDERARNYLTAAEKASKHLGKLFQDLLDVTKLDDGRIRPHLVPVDLTGLLRAIATDYNERAASEDIEFTFGTVEDTDIAAFRRVDQIVYGFVDKDFIREIMDNLIDNAIKYTPGGGSIYVNVRGDGDRALINVTDNGMGISGEDLGHIFQKFYRADNSDTRTIGGTGLGLYMVKQRVEAMGGKVWAESAFGEGSTFYVSLPRLSSDEYEKRMIVVRNEEIQEQLKAQQDQAALAAYVTQNPLPGTAGSVVAAFANNSGIDLPDPVAPIISPGGTSTLPESAAAATVAATTSVDTTASTPAETSTDTPADHPVDTPADTPANAPVETPADIPVDTSANTPTETPTETSAEAPPDTSTSTPTESPPDALSESPPGAPPDSPPIIITTSTSTALTNNLNGDHK